MAACNQCYEQPPICLHGANPATKCQAFAFTDALACRQSNGTYTATCRNSMPVETRQLDGPHIDRLVGHSPAAPAVAVLTAAETTLVANMAADTTAVGAMGDMINLLDRFPQHHEEVKRTMNRLLTSCNAAQTNHANIVYNEIARAKDALEKQTVVTATTPAAYKVINYPKATMFQSIVKNVEKGDVTQESANELLDPSTGKKYIPFEKSTKVSNDLNLMYSLQVFVITLTGLTKEAPQVYFRLSKDILRVATTDGCKIAHEYVDALLRRLDEGVFPNVVDMYKSGEHNRVLADVKATKDVGKDKDNDKDKSKKTRMTFGPVTQPIGGPGAGEIKQKCNRYHATPQQACTAGIPVGHPSGKAGQCAYIH